MKQNLLGSVAAVALATMAGLSGAHAVTITGNTVPPGSVPFTLLNLGTAFSAGMQAMPASPIAVSGETITYSGPSGVYAGNVTNVVRSPFSDLTKYLAAEPGGTLTISFATPQTAFNLLWGSVDTYNGLTFLAGGQTITGSDIIAAVPGISAGTSNAAVLISGLNPFTSISVTSTTSAFEFLPGVPVPEPGSMALLGVGLLGLGMMMRRSGGNSAAG